MEFKVLNDYEEMSQRTADLIVDTMKKYPHGLYCFAGGDTPVRTLQLLVEAHDHSIIDLRDAYYVELDEWVGLDQNNEGSCLSYLKRNLFDHVHVPDNHIHSFDSLSHDLEEECRKANEFIAEHGNLTLVLLGVGVNGHLGFNEPGVDFDQKAHVISLTQTTRDVGKKYFKQEEKLEKGITLGIKQLMES